MSCSEEESAAASVLSQMSQIQQSPSDTPESHGMSVAHQCDVETTSANSSQEIGSVTIGTIIESCSETVTAPSEFDQRIGTTTSTTTLALSSEDQEPKLQSTVEVSSVKMFQCEFCGKIFNKSYNLKTHHRVHTGERPFPCSVCGHGFANLGDLKRHARTHTGEKPFKCEFCDKAFSDFGSHKRHLRLHTGFKPFKCDQCDRQFTRLDSFKNHTRLHTGERPYKCEECQKEFNYLTTYKRHLNIHSGERPYSCDLCEKKFTRLNYLKNHKLNHTKSAINTESKGSSGTNNEEAKGATEGNNTDVPDVIMHEVANGSQGTIGDVHDRVMHQVAQALSQGGVHVSVATVMDGSGTSEPVLIQTPAHGTDSDETSHTLILTQDLLTQSSTSNNQQVLSFAADSNNKESMFVKDNGSSEEGTETRQLFITQHLFKPAQDFSADEPMTESQIISTTFDNMMTVTQQGGNIIVNDVNEQPKGAKDENQSVESISQATSADPEVSLAASISSNAVYIAIDPSQTDVQQILGELQEAVNSEPLTERT